MQVDRRVERFRLSPDTPEPSIVERHASTHAVQHHALEAELAHAPPQLRSGRVGIRERQDGKAFEPVGMGCDRSSDHVVAVAA